MIKLYVQLSQVLHKCELAGTLKYSSEKIFTQNERIKENSNLSDLSLNSRYLQAVTLKTDSAGVIPGIDGGEYINIRNCIIK